ncbi:MAG TPA: hypothetical protein PLE74_04225 [Candidatus Cloacimonadota bacterium]|nr:hypothetical protein [Candidatus Cloacimonadota bacterium]HPT71466.1 hypothetical protein [Candidatus Cloacimonadota bacterium]
MKRISRYILLIVLIISTALLFTSCKKLFQTPTITNGNINVRKLTIDDTELLIPLFADNKNSFKVQLEDLDIKIMNEKKQIIGYAEPIEKATLVPKDTTEIDLKVHLETRKVAKCITRAKNNIVFEIKGSCHATALGFGKQVEIGKRIEMPLREYLIKAVNENSGSGNTVNGGDFFRIEKTKMEYLSFNETQFSVHFMLFNPYGLALKLTGLPLSVKVNNKYAGKANLKQVIVLDEDTFKTEGDIIFTMDNWKTISSTLRSAISQEFTYECDGNINFNVAGIDLTKPVAFSGKVELNPFKNDDK